MKKFFLSLITALLCFYSYAQNVFPTPSGNVGIGTTTPNSTLNVDPQGAGGIWVGNPNGASGGFTGLYLRISAVQNGYSEIQSIQSSGSSWGRLVLNTNGGNVLIGKTWQQNAAYILDVAGTLRANGVVVNNSGADFVFASTYKLNSLSYLKKYISQNHHLPEIPSAKQMEADGLNVGDNQIKLLQKVEELTLYTIAAENAKKEQQKQIAQLKLQLTTAQIQQKQQEERMARLELQLAALLKNNKK